MNDAMNLTSQMIQLHLFRETGGETQFLLLKRSEDEPIYPNLWQVVTGFVESGETAIQAVRREALEETGLVITELFILPYVTSFFNATTDTVNFVPVFCAPVPIHDDVTLSGEHQDLLWADAGTAFRVLELPSHREGTRILIDAMERGLLERFRAP